MDRATLAAHLADDLEALADARMSRETFVAKYETQTEGPIAAIWPSLWHYLADDDIASKTATMERCKMVNWRK